MKSIPIRVDMISMKYSLTLSEFSTFLSHVTDWISTIRTPMFSMFFISVETFDETNIPPNKVPANLTGMNPAKVISAKREIENRHIDFFLAGLTKISAIRMSIAATESSNS
jgi:hypothetical protein